MDGKAEQGLCRIDTAWGHCADKWELLAPDGTVLGSRPLHLKPFRGRTPDDIPRVTVRAHDSVHAYGGRTLAVELPR